MTRRTGYDQINLVRNEALFYERRMRIFLLCLLIPAATRAAPTFQEVYTKVIDAKCTSCHGLYRQSKGVRFLTYEDVLHYVNFKDLPNSTLIQITAYDTMPEDPAPPLTDSEKALLKEWILAGAPR